MEAGIKKNQTILLKDGSTLEIDGVSNVEGLGDDYVEIMTVRGGITVEGAGLKIEELRQENGKIVINGEIKGFFYRPEKSANFFSRKIR